MMSKTLGSVSVCAEWLFTEGETQALKQRPPLVIAAVLVMESHPACQPGPHL